ATDINADHGNCAVEVLGHGVLLVFGAPCQIRRWRGRSTARSIPLPGITHLSTGRLLNAGLPDNLMELPSIKLAEGGEFRPGSDKQFSPLVISGFGFPQRLQVPIYAHQRHTEHLAELSVCER